jgi:hypothetical protein
MDASANDTPTTNTTEPSARNATTPAARPLRRRAGATAGGLAGCRAMGAGVCVFCRAWLFRMHIRRLYARLWSSRQACRHTLSGSTQRSRSRPSSRSRTHATPPKSSTIQRLRTRRENLPVGRSPSSSSDMAARLLPNARHHTASTSRSLMLHPTLARIHLCAHRTTATDMG